jgi:ABC-type bacteriocin/lantibiotic exporter with double-glycine peptidase domain
MSSNPEKQKKISLKPFEQSTSYCGPASLKILLSHYGKDFTEEQLAKLTNATRDNGTEHEGMIEAIKEIGGHVFVKENGTIDELIYFVEEEQLPVIIGWFDKDGDHYSVVASITPKNIIIVDPAVNVPERWLDRDTFSKIWFDFVGKDNKIVSWGWYMVVTFEKKKFKVTGGHYY